MIEPYLSGMDVDFIEVSWNPPKYKPSIFKLSVACTRLCDGERYLVYNESLLPSATSFQISQLHDGTTCYITLIAVYNPASLDPGILIQTYTRNQSKMCVNFIHLQIIPLK